jgi:hypothetical protein
MDVPITGTRLFTENKDNILDLIEKANTSREVGLLFLHWGREEGRPLTSVRSFHLSSSAPSVWPLLLCQPLGHGRIILETGRSDEQDG